MTDRSDDPAAVSLEQVIANVRALADECATAVEPDGSASVAPVKWFADTLHALLPEAKPEIRGRIAAQMPDGHPVEVTEPQWSIQFREDPAGDWTRWAVGHSPEAVRAALAEFRDAKPAHAWRAVREVHTYTQEAW